MYSEVVFGWPAKVQFVLNDEVGRAQRAMRLAADFRKPVTRRVIARIVFLDFRGKKAVTHTEPVYLHEEILNLALPRHLRKFINRRDEQGRRSAVTPRPRLKRAGQGVDWKSYHSIEPEPEGPTPLDPEPRMAADAQ